MCPGPWSLVPAGSAPALPRLLSGRVLQGQTALQSQPAGGLLCSSQPLPCPRPPQLFDIRPIWSRNAVRAKISVHPDKLKVLLPFMAYYMVSVCPAAAVVPTRSVLVPEVTSEPEQAALSRPSPESTLGHLG